jgi:hypothetical protein
VSILLVWDKLSSKATYFFFETQEDKSTMDATPIIDNFFISSVYLVNNLSLTSTGIFQEWIFWNGNVLEIDIFLEALNY